jgi:hypothetical protein
MFFTGESGGSILPPPPPQRDLPGNKYYIAIEFSYSGPTAFVYAGRPFAQWLFLFDSCLFGLIPILAFISISRSYVEELGIQE